MKIGNVEVNTHLALGPMAGVTDLAFRQVCREKSGCYTVTEMVSAKALCYGDKKTPTLLKLGEEEHPAAVQIFGCDEPFMEKGAALALERSGADIIDINMGCPVPNVFKSGEGSALTASIEGNRGMPRVKPPRTVDPFFAHKQSQKSTEAELVSCGITDFAVYYRQILVTGEGRDHICLTISLR